METACSSNLPPTNQLGVFSVIYSRLGRFCTMSIFNKVFGGLFSSKTPAKELDLLDLAQQNLDKVKAEASALKELEAKKKAEELKQIERATKLASIDRELESTYNSMTAGHKRVKKIEKRIADLKQEEQEKLQAHLDKARELRAKFEASLWEEEEETPPAHTPSSTAPASNPTAPVPGVPSTRKGSNNASNIVERCDNPNIK